MSRPILCHETKAPPRAADALITDLKRFENPKAADGLGMPV